MSNYINKETKISDSNITLKDLSYDSGWLELSISESFEKYSSTVACKYRRVGKIVYVKGILKPKQTIESDGSAEMFTLPEGFRPKTVNYTLCQGSGCKKWLLTLDAGGKGTFSRYSDSSNSACSTSAWLPFNVMYFVD